MPYEIPQSLRWEKFVTLWDEAGDALARLDQCLIQSDLKAAWLRRADLAQLARSCKFGRFCTFGPLGP